MPVDIKDLYARRLRPLSINLGNDDAGDPIEIVIKWSPEAYTKEVHAAIAEHMGAAEKDVFAIAESILVPLVKWWDLTDGGVMLPITAENIASLGLFIEQEMVERVMTDMEVPANLKGTSGGTSLGVAVPDSSSPTGT